MSCNLFDLIKKYNILILIIFGLLLYFSSLFYDILDYDDISYIMNNQYLNGRVPISFFDFFKPNFIDSLIYTPLTCILYWSIIKLFGISSFVFHFVNLLFYIFSSIALYYLLKKIIKNDSISFFAVILYILHPCHIENTVWISAMGYNISVLFFCLSFLYFIFAFDENKKLNYIYSVIFYILAILSQPIAVTLPVILFLWIYCFRKERLKESIICILSYIPFLFIYLFLYKQSVFKARFDNFFEYNFFQKISFLGEYLFNSFIPIHLCPIQPLPYLYTIIYLFIFILFIYYLKDNKIFLFFCLFELVCIIPYSNIFFPLVIPIADRYVLLSSVSSCVLISYLSFYLLDKYKEKNILKFVSFSFFFILYLGSFLSYLPVWKNDIILWNYSYKVNPNDINVKKAYAKILISKKQYDEAINLADEIIEEKPNLLDAYELKIKGLIGKSLYREALDVCFLLLNKVSSEKQWIYLCCFDIYINLQEYDKASEYFNYAYQLRKQDDVNEINLLARKRIILSYINAEPEKYIEDFKLISDNFKILNDNGELLKILDDNIDYKEREELLLNYLKNYKSKYSNEIVNLLSVMYMREIYRANALEMMHAILKDMNGVQEFINKGDDNSAEKIYLDVISKNKYMYQAYYNLGVFYIQTKRQEKAKNIFSKMLNINPNDEQVKQLYNSL